MQRIFNWDDWNTLVDGGEADFDGTHERRVVLEVNAEDKVRLYVEEEGTWHFLALVEGRDEVHFAVGGGFALRCEGGTAHFKTAETADWSVEPVDDTTFTTLMERRIRNPDLELMMYQANLNVERRIAEQREEFERRLSALDTARNVPVVEPVVPPAPVPEGDGAADGGAPSGEGETPDGTEPPDGATPAPVKAK